MNNFVCKQITENSPHYNQCILSFSDIRKLAIYQQKRGLYRNPAKQSSPQYSYFEAMYNIAKGTH